MMKIKKYILAMGFASILAGVSFAEGENQNAAKTKECASASLRMKAASFNIRFWDAKGRWEEIKDLIAPLICFHEFDIVGTQEMSPVQRDYVLAQCDGQYAFSSAIEMSDAEKPRHYLKNMNNFILYKKDKFEVLEEGAFWLGKNPYPASKITSGWGEKGQNRFCVWAKFREKSGGKIFYWFNTHLNQLDEGERLESCKLIRSEVLKIAGELPFFISGDFNARPESKPIMEMCPAGNMQIVDARSICKSTIYGPIMGYHGFTGKVDLKASPIDYIFVSPKIEVFKCGTLTDNLNGVYPSDHFPLLAEVEIK